MGGNWTTQINSTQINKDPDSDSSVLNQNAASQFLVRHRRANSLFEESKKGNLERECIEELCNKEEAREIFENQPETVRGAAAAC